MDTTNNNNEALKRFQPINVESFLVVSDMTWSLSMRQYCLLSSRWKPFSPPLSNESPAGPDTRILSDRLHFKTGRTLLIFESSVFRIRIYWFLNALSKPGFIMLKWIDKVNIDVRHKKTIQGNIILDGPDTFSSDCRQAPSQINIGRIEAFQSVKSDEAIRCVTLLFILCFYADVSKEEPHFSAAGQRQSATVGHDRHQKRRRNNG